MIKKNTLKVAREVYSKIKQSLEEVNLSERYVYGRDGKYLDTRLLDMTVKDKGFKYIKSRGKKYTDEYNNFFSKQIEKQFTFNGKLEVNEFELVGTVEKDEFLLDIKIKDFYKVNFASEINQKSKQPHNKDRYIKVYHNNLEECDEIIFYCIGLNDNVSSFFSTIKQICEYNDKHDKRYGFVCFYYLGTGNSGNTVERGDDSFVNDGLLVFKYIHDNFKDKSIIFSSECFGCSISIRILCDLNLDCISRNVNFHDVYRVKNLLYCVPYTSTADLKKDQKFITDFFAKIILKIYRYGAMSKFSNFDMISLMPNDLNFVFIQARNAVFLTKNGMFDMIPNFIKNIFLLRESDNFVSFRQSYRLAKEFFLKNRNLFFFYDKNTNHDNMLGLFWQERLHILTELSLNKLKGKAFGIMNLRTCYSIDKVLNFINKNHLKNYDNLFTDIANFLKEILLFDSVEKHNFILNKIKTFRQKIENHLTNKHDKILQKISLDLKIISKKLETSYGLDSEIRNNIIA